MSSLSPSIQAVVQLFEGPLSGVRFADIDGSGLGRLATEVEEATRQVQAHEAQLAELRQVLAQRQEALLTLAQRALSYARVYAEGDEALTAELAQIALPKPSKPRKKEATAGSPQAESDAASSSAVTSSEPLDEAAADARPTSEGAKEAPPRAVNRRGRGRAKAAAAGA